MKTTGLRVFQTTSVLFLLLSGLWTSTQLTAHLLGYQRELGAPLFTLAGYLVYAPWKFIQWYFVYGAYAERAFLVGSIPAYIGPLLAVIWAIAVATVIERKKRKSTTYGSARWATAAEVKEAGLLENAGVVIGQANDKKLLRHDGEENILVFAPTRSGKGVGLVIPTLLSWPESCIVHDIKGECWMLSAGFRSQFSHCIYFDPTSEKSARFNPLLEIRKGANEIRDTQNVADILVDPEGGKPRRDHWEKTSHSLLVGAILHVLYAEPDKTLSGVANFLSDPERSFTETLDLMIRTPHLGDRPHPTVAHFARECLNKSPNELSGVFSTTMTFLSLYRDPVIARNTAASDFRIRDLMNAAHPVSLYLVIPPSDINRTKPLVRLMLNQAGRLLTEKLNAPGDPAAYKHRLLLMLDEFPQLGRLEFFESALGYLAGYGIKCFLIAQSLNQIEKAYGPNHAILDNCHVRVAFATNDEKTAKRISETLSTKTEAREQRNYAGHRLAPWLAHVMVSSAETPRQLLTPGEIMQLSPTREIVMIGGMAPILAKKLRYYKDPRFKKRVMAPPPLSTAGCEDAPEESAPDDWEGLLAEVPEERIEDQGEVEADGPDTDIGPDAEIAIPLSAFGEEEDREPQKGVETDPGLEDQQEALEKKLIERARTIENASEEGGLSF